MDIFEMHTYGRMPVLPPPAPPAPPEMLAFDVLFKRRAPPLRGPSALASLWRTLLTSRN